MIKNPIWFDVSPIEGYVVVVTSPLHIGRMTQIWQIMITDQQDRLVCVSRITMAILDNSTTSEDT